jgi:hypothetical protein
VRVAESSRTRDWINGRITIKGHAFDRAIERLAEKFSGIDRGRAGKMLERALRHPSGTVEPIDEINNGEFMVAVPFIDTSDQSVIGYMVAAKSWTHEDDVVVVTFLETGMIEAQKARRQRQRFEFTRLPLWWRKFQTAPDKSDLPGGGDDG